MANLLEFSLGLKSAEFLSELGVASGEVLSFAALADTVRVAWDETWQAMERGAALKGMASAVGENVSQLYQFQQGLDAIGQAFNPMSMLQFQKALSGVNEAGENTNILFARLGLDLSHLRGEDTVKSITEISAALTRLNPNQSAGIAESIFGRFGAEQVLAMSRNMDEFQKHFAASGETGALLEKFSTTFEEVKADWADVENDVNGVWTAIAGGIAPELLKVFSTVHDEIKNIGPAIAGAVGTGHLEELLDDALAAAWEESKNYGQAAFEWLAAFLGDTLGAVLQAVFIGLPSTIADVAANSSAIMAVNKAKKIDQDDLDKTRSVVTQISGMTDAQFTAKTNAEKQKYLSGGNADLTWLGQAGNTRSQALGNLRSSADSLQTGIDTQNGTINNLMAQSTKSIHDNISTALTDMGSAASQGVKDGDAAWQNVLKHAPHGALQTFVALKNKDAAAGVSNPSSASGPGAQGTASVGNLEPSRWHMEFTSLEKMGFVMKGGGVGNPMDLRKVGLLQEIRDGIHQLASPSGHSHISDPLTNAN